MNSLQNLSIRNKFFLIVFPILIGIIYLVFIRTQSSLELSNNLEDLNDGVSLSVQISDVVHEIQKERGNSSGFLSNAGNKFGPQLEAQRELTDQALLYLNAAFEDPTNAHLLTNSQALEELNALLEQIPVLRNTVTELGFTPNEAIDAYTEINTYALNYLNELFPRTGRSDIALQIQGYINFLKSKERAGIERAIGSQAFSKGQMDAEVYKRFSTLVAQQDAYMDAFLVTAESETKTTYYETVTGAEVDEVNRMRILLYQNENLSEDPIYWFAQITGKIELLKRYEDDLASKVVGFSEDLAANATKEFWTFLIVTVLLIVLDIILLFSILFGLLGNIKTLSNFTKQVSAGDLSGSVHVKSKDELGQFANTLNTTVGAIQVAQKDLQGEKDKAQDLYENIYKTSEVVFENVSQGIFLIKSDMKISNLYSTSTHEILGREKIAGVDFLDLMKPMLVPRDMEALRMFAKHLFNPHVKDKVLGRLNPVEQVQIFASSDKENPEIGAKYIRVSFSRITRDKKVESVMVTLLDETQSVLLKQRIRDNEEKKNEETDQLLNIIKINPIALREYLDKAEISLNEIYVRYEKDKTKDFSQLLTFTFNIVHNLKGNASLIELELIEEKLHTIEESLIKLRGKAIKGDDFVKVLYEINGLKDIISDMDGMLSKIAAIYHESSSKEMILSNDRFVNSIEKAIDRIGKEVGKKAVLVFRNEEDIILPEKDKLQINDVMVQMIRNSMAHGIETPGERMDAGKHSVATIQIEIEETPDGRLSINYSDDGRGLDQDKILMQAKKQGLVSGERATLKEEEVYKLIFEEGFSTAAQVGRHAGRGQGMSVIAATLEKIKAEYTISSIAGSRFEMNFSMPLNENLNKTVV